VEFFSRGKLSYYRVSLPALAGQAATSFAGTWHAVLALSRKARGAGADVVGHFRAPALSYNLLVHSYSSLRLKVSVHQKSFEPGAEVSLAARLTEYEVPVEKRALVRAEITRPDGSATTLALAEKEAGYFEALFTANQTGVYTIRVRATGTTFYGKPFQREQTLTAATALGGDRQPGPDAIITWLDERDRRLCRLLGCLLKEGGHMRELGIDREHLEKCLAEYCQRPARFPPEGIEAGVRPSGEAAHIAKVRAKAKPGERVEGFAELEEGQPVDWTVRGEKREGPMFGLSPEDEKAGEGWTKRKPGGKPPGGKPPRGKRPHGK
jgi:hypothetical protein